MTQHSDTLNIFITLTGCTAHKLPEKLITENWFKKYDDYVLVEEQGKQGNNPHYHGYITSSDPVVTIKRKLYKDLYGLSTRQIKTFPNLIKCVRRAGTKTNVGYIFKEESYKLLAENIGEEEIKNLKVAYAKQQPYKYCRVCEVPRILLEYWIADTYVSANPLKAAAKRMIEDGYNVLSWYKNHTWIAHEFYRLLAHHNNRNPNDILNKMVDGIFGEAAKYLAPLPPMMSPPPLYDPVNDP